MSFKICFALLVLHSQIIFGDEILRCPLNLKRIERIGKGVTEERKPPHIIIHNYYEFGQCFLNPLETMNVKHDNNGDQTSTAEMVKMKGSSADKKTQDDKAAAKTEDIEEGFNLKVLPLNVFVDGKKLGSEDAQNEKFEVRKKQRGEKITVSHFKLIVDDVENNIGEMRVYVPDGISGPLNRYFERLEPHQARHAYQNGVVRLSNGTLIPLKTIITVVDFRNWLKRQKESNFSEEYPRKDSYTKPIYSFNDFIMYLVNFKFVNVILPNSHLVPLIDCQSYLDHFPTEAKKRVILDIVGYEMPLFHFEQCLKLQC